MILNVAYILFGLAALFFGGNWLVRGASRLAASLGVKPLVIGLTVVSFGTSVPELMVSLNAAFSGTSDIAIGNVVGSNIANIGLILAVSGLIVMIPIHFDLIKREIPVVIVGSLLIWIMAQNHEVNQLDGLLLVSILVVFNFFLIRASLRERLRPTEVKELVEEEGVVGPINRMSELGWIVLGLVVLLVGANRLVEGTVAVARALQVSEVFISLTLVAIGTSLPELVASVVAANKREGDILFGNIIGSNIFNLFGIVGITALVRPIAIAPRLANIEIPVMIGFALVLVVFVFRGRLPRWASALLLAAYFAFIVLLLADESNPTALTDLPAIFEATPVS
ncbi:MAG: calcium/sodium antiporter [Anaerolineae bacterium]